MALSSGQKPLYAVVGAGGKTGSLCVQEALRHGYRARAVVRDPSKYAGKFEPDAEVVAGDVKSPATLSQALDGAKGVIFAASAASYFDAYNVDYKGLEAVANAAKERGLDRVVVVSSMLVTPKNRWNPIRLILNNVKWGLMDNKFRGEEALRKSGVPYTIVRPGGLSDDPPKGLGAVKVLQGDTGSGGGRISRADVAKVCVEALAEPTAKNITLEIMGKPGVQEVSAADMVTPSAFFSTLATD
eukprot:jgi/Chlat1/4333/Chrsp29S04488